MYHDCFFFGISCYLFGIRVKLYSVSNWRWIEFLGRINWSRWFSFRCCRRSYHIFTEKGEGGGSGHNARKEIVYFSLLAIYPHLSFTHIYIGGWVFTQKLCICSYLRINRRKTVNRYLLNSLFPCSNISLRCFPLVFYRSL